MNKFDIKSKELDEIKTEPKSVKQIVKANKAGAKDKMISVKVNSSVYEDFTRINKALGMSNNSCINSLIARYVMDNKVILDNE